MSELVPRQELQAAVHAHRELGPEYEDAVVDGIVEKIERRLAQRGDPREERRGTSFVLAAISLGVGIPITAIALSNGGLVALVIAWLGIVLVNIAATRR